MTIKDTNDLVSVLHDRRDSLGFSQRELVRRSNVGAATISRMENERKDYQNLRAQTIFSLLDALGMEMQIQVKNQGWK